MKLFIPCEKGYEIESISDSLIGVFSTKELAISASMDYYMNCFHNGQNKKPALSIKYIDENNYTLYKDNRFSSDFYILEIDLNKRN